jgi:hypothetical protein
VHLRNLRIGVRDLGHFIPLQREQALKWRNLRAKSLSFEMPFICWGDCTNDCEKREQAKSKF